MIGARARKLVTPVGSINQPESYSSSLWTRAGRLRENYATTFPYTRPRAYIFQRWNDGNCNLVSAITFSTTTITKVLIEARIGLDWRWRNSRFVRHSIPWDRTCKRDRGIVRVQNLDPRIDTHIRVCVQDLESLVRGKLAQSRFYILLIKSSFSSSTSSIVYTCVAIASVVGQLTKVSEEFRNFQLGNRFVLLEAEDPRYR